MPTATSGEAGDLEATLPPPPKTPRPTASGQRKHVASTVKELENAEYDPEVLRMAEYLGIDPQADRALLWIADEALDAPMPTPWEGRLDKQGQPYYVHGETGEATREHPLDRFFMELHLILKRNEVDSVIEARVTAANRAGLNVTEMALPARELSGGIAEVVREENARLRQQMYGLERTIDALRFEVAVVKRDRDRLEDVLAAERERFAREARAGVEGAGDARAERAEAALAALESSMRKQRERAAEDRKDWEARMREILAERKGQHAANGAAEEVSVSTAGPGAEPSSPSPAKDGALAAKLEAAQAELRGVRAELDAARAAAAGSAAPAASAAPAPSGSRADGADASRPNEGAARDLEEARARAASAEARVQSLEKDLAAARAGASTSGGAEGSERALEQAAREVAEARREAEAAAGAAKEAWAAEARLSSEVEALRTREAAWAAAAAGAEQALAAVRALRPTAATLRGEVGGLAQEVAAWAARLRDVPGMVRGLTLHADEVVQRAERKVELSVADRRRMFTELLKIKGNIRVFCRVRPVNKKELQESPEEAFVVPDDPSRRTIEIKSDGSRVTGQMYEFDRVFGPKSTQEEVFSDVRGLVEAAFEGFNVTIFAYGQTGSGKTFTMEGPPEDPGITTRAFQTLCHIASEGVEDEKHWFAVSMLEVYNEQIRDLFATKEDAGIRYEVKQDEFGSTYVSNLRDRVCATPEDFLRAMREGAKSRATASTNMNEHSSRSHLVMTVRIHSHNARTGAKTSSRISFVDLAGSERLAKSQAEGARMKEAISINKSLSALGDVINALASKQSRSHIPYRNSKLTQILQDSLGNDSKTLLIVTCSPAATNAHESNCSLMFASLAAAVDLSAGGSAAQKAMANKFKALVEQMKKDQGIAAGSTPTKDTATLQRQLELCIEEKEQAIREAEELRMRLAEANVEA